MLLEWRPLLVDRVLNSGRDHGFGLTASTRGIYALFASNVPSQNTIALNTLYGNARGFGCPTVMSQFTFFQLILHNVRLGARTSQQRPFCPHETV